MTNKKHLFTAMAQARPLFLDTETTGLNSNAEICEIAIIDYDGDIQLATFVRPTHIIPADATRIHAITDADVTGAPTFAQLYDQINEILYGRNIVIYNADYDVRIMEQSARAHHLTFAPRAQFHCAMKAYAEYYGDFDGWRGGYRWKKLAVALAAESIPLAGMRLHGALADAELTRRLVRKLAGD